MLDKLHSDLIQFRSKFFPDDLYFYSFFSGDKQMRSMDMYAIAKEYFKYCFDSHELTVHHHNRMREDILFKKGKWVNFYTSGVSTYYVGHFNEDDPLDRLKAAVGRQPNVSIINWQDYIDISKEELSSNGCKFYFRVEACSYYNQGNPNGSPLPCLKEYPIIHLFVKKVILGKSIAGTSSEKCIIDDYGWDK